MCSYIRLLGENCNPYFARKFDPKSRTRGAKKGRKVRRISMCFSVFIKIMLKIRAVYPMRRVAGLLGWVAFAANLQNF
jgi:hypothetical protein